MYTVSRRFGTVMSSVALGVTALIMPVGSASAAVAAGVPDTCAGSTAGQSSTDGGAAACWYPHGTMKICDTKADGDTPHVWIRTRSGNYQDEGSDPYGSGGCVWNYPSSATYEQSNGTVVFYITNENSSHQVVSTSGYTSTASW